MEEQFVAPQTSMGIVVNRLRKLDATVARQGDATQHLMNGKLRESSAADSGHDTDASSGDSSDGGIVEQCKISVGGSCWGSSQQHFCADTTDTAATRDTTMFEPRFPPNKPFGHVKLTNPHPSRAEWYECKQIALFARHCPKRTNKSDQLNWVQLELRYLVPPPLKFTKS